MFLKRNFYNLTQGDLTQSCTPLYNFVINWDIRILYNVMLSNVVSFMTLKKWNENEKINNSQVIMQGMLAFFFHLLVTYLNFSAALLESK